MTLSSSDPAVKMMIETIRNQDNSAHAAVDRIKNIRSHEAYRAFKGEDHPLYDLLEREFHRLDSEKEQEKVFLDREWDWLASLQIVTGKIQHERAARAPGLAMQSHEKYNYLTVAGAEIGELVAQYREVESSLLEIQSVLQHEGFREHAHHSKLEEYLMMLINYKRGEKRDLHQSLATLMNHHLIGTDGHDHFKAHLELLAKEHEFHPSNPLVRHQSDHSGTFSSTVPSADRLPTRDGFGHRAGFLHDPALGYGGKSALAHVPSAAFKLPHRNELPQALLEPGKAHGMSSVPIQLAHASLPFVQSSTASGHTRPLRRS